MTSITLNCSFLGPDVTVVFSVKALLDENVGQLKRFIKNEWERELDQITAPRLVIWKVSDTAQLIRHHEYIAPRSQLKDPLPRGHIVATLGRVVNGEEIPGAFELDSMNLLSRYFPEPPVPEMLHLVAKCWYQSSAPACPQTLICCYTSANYYTVFQSQQSSGGSRQLK